MRATTKIIITVPMPEIETAVECYVRARLIESGMVPDGYAGKITVWPSSWGEDASVQDVEWTAETSLDARSDPERGER